MIYFLKGKRYETEKGSHKWEQHCPLIRGYRKLIGTDYEYAPSLFYPKPENKSGWGKLGKGWEPFTVWDCEEVGGVEGWINKLCERSENGGFIIGQDVIGQQFKIPPPYFRNQRHIDSWVRQAVAKEQNIEKGRQEVNKLVSKGMPLDIALDYYFPQRRRGCHYPTDCEMLDVCYKETVFNDPVGSGIYVYRKPHHDPELEMHESRWGKFEIHPLTEMQREVIRAQSNKVSSPSVSGGAKKNKKAELVNVNLDDEVMVDE